MARQRLILVASIAALLGMSLWAWCDVTSRQPKLTFTGFRYFQLDQRWYVDLQVRNRSSRTIHCDGYVAEVSGGLKTNDSMLDFRCTVTVGDKQVQSWPLWFATWLDLKPGETASLSLNIDPNNLPKRVGLRYTEIQPPPGRMAAVLNKARYYARRVLRLRLRHGMPNSAAVTWCSAKLAFEPASAMQTQSKTQAVH